MSETDCQVALVIVPTCFGKEMVGLALQNVKFWLLAVLLKR